MKQTLLSKALLAGLIISISACDGKSSNATPPETPPTDDDLGKVETPIEPVPTEQPPVDNTVEVETFDKKVGLDLTGQFVGMHDHQLYNFNSELEPTNPVQMILESNKGNQKTSDLLRRGQLLFETEGEFLVLAQARFFGYPADEETHLVHKQTGAIWLLPNKYFPANIVETPENAVQYREHGDSKYLFVLVHGGDAYGTSSIDYAPIGGDVVGVFDASRKKSVLKIDISDSTNPKASLITPPHIDVVNFRADRDGNLLFTGIDLTASEQELSYALIQGKDQPTTIQIPYEDLGETLPASFGADGSRYLRLHGTWASKNSPLYFVYEGSLHRVEFSIDENGEGSITSPVVEHADSGVSSGFGYGEGRVVHLDDDTVVFLNHDGLILVDIESNVATIFELGLVGDAKFLVKDAHLYLTDGQELDIIHLETKERLTEDSIELPKKGAVADISLVDESITISVYRSPTKEHFQMTFATNNPGEFEVVQTQKNAFFAVFFDLIKVN
ncbi:MAG: hypothetical protein HRU19_12555 [Pseudobacteriovorax sp.]|nr:hypothetical protein [Pseudobacteriovorax sp.]